ncbi:MAG: T9SS type A sorting domain-containing protein [Chitinophagales bacterium]|nr:T9SS type A sorting domain-containing protein [Chitinophagales bacterium]
MQVNILKISFLFLFHCIFSTSLFAQPIPKSIPNLKAWYRADSLITLTGGAVSSWGDASGGGFTALQGTVANRPIPTTVASLNNKAVVRFDGSNDFLLVNTFNQSQPLTVFAIWKVSGTNANTANVLFDGIDATNRLALFAYQAEIRAVGGGTSLSYAKAIPTNYLLNSILYNGSAQSEIYESGVKKASNNIIGSNVLTGLNIGRLYTNNAGFLNGDIAEMIFYDRALDSIERQQVERYLRNKYAPPVTLGNDTIVNSFCPFVLNAQKPWFSSYLWNTGANTASISIAQSGIYSVAVTDIFGYKSYDTIQVTLPSKDSLHFVPQSRTLCYGDSTLLSVALQNKGFSFTWNTGATTETIYAKNAGNYSVTITDAQGCSVKSDTLVVKVDSLSVLASLGNDTSMCAGNKIALQRGQIPGLTYLWSDGSTMPTLAIINSGSYSLLATTANGCEFRDTILVTISGVAPTVTFTADTVCFGASTSFFPTTIPSVVDSLFWDFGGGLNSKQISPMVTLPAFGNVSASLTAYSNGCSAIIIDTAYVYKNPVAGIASQDTFCLNSPATFSEANIISPEQTVQTWEWDISSIGTFNTSSVSTSFSSLGNYFVKHKVVTDKQCSDSTTKNIIIAPAVAPPTAIALTSPVDLSSFLVGTITFSWSSANNANKYKLQVSTDTAFQTIIENTSTTNTSATLTIPESSVFYYWRVIALNRCGDSSVSLYRTFSVFKVTTIPNLKAWYRADSLITLTGGAVSSWGDASGGGFTALQGTAANRPIPTTVASLNNKPVVRFDGSNDFLLVNTFNQNQPLTVFAIWKVSGTNTTSANTLFDGVDATNRLTFMAYQGELRAVGGGTALGYAKGIPTNYLLNSILYNGSSQSEIYESGVKKTSSNTIGSNVLTALNIGRLFNNAGSLNGDIAEMIFYDRALDSIERQQVERYLRNKYAPPVSLGPDINFAYGACDTTLRIKNHFTKVLWSTGDTNVYTLKVKQSGSYWVRATDVFGFVSTDTINVVVPYSNWKMNRVNDTVMCVGNSILFEYNITGSPYSLYWSTGDSGTNQITVTQAGNYFVQVKDTIGCALTSDTISVAIDSIKYFSVLDNDTIACTNAPLGLYTYNYPYSTFSWSTNGNKDTISIPGGGLLYVTVTDVNGCSVRDSINVAVKGVAPAVDFSFTNKCFGDTTVFTNLTTVTAPEQITQWVWNMGSNDTLLDQNPIKYFPVVGSFNVALTAVTDSGCVTTKTKVVAIGSRPKPLVSYNITCANSSTLISDASTIVFGDTIISYVWTLPNGATYTTRNLTYKFDSVGIHPVKLVVSSTKGCVDSTIANIEVFPPINAGFVFDNQCIGKPTVFKDTTHSLSISKRVWKLTNLPGVINDSMQFEKTFYTADSFDVIYEVTNAIGCKDTVQKTVVIYPTPIADFIDSAGCVGGSVTLQQSSVSSDSIVSFDWKFGSKTSKYIAPTFALPDTGKVSVSLKIKTLKGCVDSATKTFTILSLPKAEFVFDPFFGEAPLNVTMTNQSQRATSYFWNFGNGDFSTDKDPTVTYLNNDTFDIKLIAQNNLGCADSISKKMVVIPTNADIELISINTQRTQLADGNFSVTIIARYANVGTQPIVSAQFLATIERGNTIMDDWSGLLRPGEVLVHTFSSQFYVSKSAKTQYVCVDAINVNNGAEKNLSNNKNCKSIDNQLVVTKLYPNPAAGTVFLDIIIPDATNFTFEISNEMGQRLLRNAEFNAVKGYNKVDFDVRSFLPGIYFLKTIYNDNVEIQKFQVVR